jgi:hypothetical protein
MLTERERDDARRQLNYHDGNARSALERIDSMAPYLRGRIMRDVGESQRLARYWREVVEADTYPVRRMLGKCATKGCRFVTSTMAEIRPGYAMKPTLKLPEEVRCPEHNRPVRWAEVKGTFNPDVPCDVRCTSARGSRCECSCAGLNHGVDHGH